MLRQLQNCASRRFSRSAPPTVNQAQESAQDKRESRAKLVTDLQAQVRRLQQDITDLTAIQNDGTEGKKGQVSQAKLAAHETELSQKQQELSRLQGRI